MSEATDSIRKIAEQLYGAGHGGDASAVERLTRENERLKPTLHIDTVVFDIAMIDNDFMLIEINPYGRSDPCWFGSYAAVESATGPIQTAQPPHIEG